MNSSIDQRTARADWLIAGSVFALALFVRLLFLFSSADQEWPHSIYYEGDAPQWVDYSIALDKGDLYEFDLPIHSPSVGYMLHWLYPGVHEHGFVSAKVLWCALSAGACGVLYLCGVASFGRRVAMIASGLCVFSFGQYIMATSLNTEAPYTLLLALIVWLTPHVISTGAHWQSASLGMLHGFATLFRAEHTLLLLILCAWMLWQRWLVVSTDDSDKSGFMRRWVNAGAPITLMAIAMFVACALWTVHSVRAIKMFNRVAAVEPDFKTSPIPWTADAQASLNRLPAFARKDNFQYLNFLANQRHVTSINAETVELFFKQEFDWSPKPLSPWVLVSNQGPLSFALANDRRSEGGFSRAGLDHPIMGKNQKFSFGFPPHLKLMIDGYSVGMQEIKADVPGWLALVQKKFGRFSGGVTLGFTAYNLPIGRVGIRQPVDLMTAAPDTNLIWRGLIAALLTMGMLVALMRRRGGIWILVIAYKLLVTIAFYGYARQAVSIGPAFFVIMALAMDQICDWIAPRITLPGRAWIAGAFVVVVACLTIDIVAAVERSDLAITGPHHMSPRWGPGSFESFEAIRIAPAVKPSGQ